ncbi:MAG: holo-ACP synthase [Candidatus Nanopelagicales bacterium]|nr:holo-ACP synthase [Candidatus Nanopelagicales bacterium]MDZ4248549.1 holo-ACP synthase [Candidatus Nanopelagicales bacterium]MDZ7577332.1 holo-ACP synthase [Candidatus Nanopelagicales bacterium]
MIVGIGVDVVNIPMFDATIHRAPGFAEMLFTAKERIDEGGGPRSSTSLAARYAAKQALAKALGVPSGLRWHDCEVMSEPDGRPYLSLRGGVLAAARDLGARSWHLSLATEADVAVAYVIAEGIVSLEGVETPRAIRESA